MRASIIVRGAAALILSASASPAFAAFHFWDLTEIYSNHDGSIQFVELFTTSGFETQLASHTLTATSTVAGTPTVRTFNIPTNLSGSSANKRLLFASAGFSPLPGAVTPDYVLTTAEPFFNPNADTIRIDFAGVDILQFAGTLLPKNGVNSLVDASPSGTASLSAQTNSPTNYALAAGSISVSATPTLAADFTLNGSVDGGDLASLTTNFSQAGPLIRRPHGDANGDLSVDGADVLVLQQDLVIPPPFSAVPEPAGFFVVLWLFAPVAVRWRAVR